MAQVRANGIDIEYETFGAETDPAILLIMGLNAQMTIWREALSCSEPARVYAVWPLGSCTWK